MGTPIVIAKKTTDTTQDIVLHSQFANRHGLIAGATGTGKPVSGCLCFWLMQKEMFPV